MEVLFFDLLDTFVHPLEKVLGVASSQKVGLSHGMSDIAKYSTRISAMNFALDTDDGMNMKRYNRSEVIIVGVSRTGKTPTSLYLALQYAIYATNYPLTKEDLSLKVLPKSLEPYRDK